MNNCKPLLSVVLALFLCSGAVSQTWDFIGGPPVSIGSIFQDGDSLFVASGNDVLVSVDGGLTWKSILLAPLEDQNAFGSYGYGAFTSQKLIFTDFDMAFVIQNRRSYIASDENLHLTFDKGRTLSPGSIATTNVSNKSLSRFLEFKAKDRNIFTYSVRHSVSYYGDYNTHGYTHDRGDTWQPLLAGRFDQILGFTPLDEVVMLTQNGLAVRPFDDSSAVVVHPLPAGASGGQLVHSFVAFNTVFLLYDFGGDPRQLRMYRSVDWGANWVPGGDFTLPAIATSYSYKFYVHDGQIFAVSNTNPGEEGTAAMHRKSIYGSDDFVQVTTLPVSNAQTFTLHPNGRYLYLTTDNWHFLRSDDNGISWQFMPGLPGTGQPQGGYRLKFFGADEIWAASGSGVANRSVFRYDEKPVWQIERLDFSAYSSSKTIQNFEKFKNDYYYSTTEGKVYKHVPGSTGELAFTPPDGLQYYNNRLFNPDGQYLYYFFGTFCYYSADAVHWEQLPLPTEPGYQIPGSCYRFGNRLALSYGSYGFFVTEDNGTTWTKTRSQIEVAPKLDTRANQLYFVYLNPDNVFVLISSSDQGISWQERTIGGIPAGVDITQVQYFGYDFLKRGNKILGRMGFSLFSKYQLAEWEPLVLPLRTPGSIYTSPAGEVYIVSMSDGVYRSSFDRLFPAADGDLRLSMAGSPGNIPAYSYGTATLTLRNEGKVTMTGIAVEVSLPSGKMVLRGGNQYSSSQGVLKFSWTAMPLWEVGTLAPGQTATLQLNIFTLSGNEFTLFGQVKAANPDDIDSYPGNGTCCTPEEDDEAAFTFNTGAPPTLKPDLALSNFRLPASAAPGAQVSYSFDLKNIGQATALGDYVIGLYLSTDAALSSSDIQVGFVNTGNTPVGTIANVPGVFDIPANTAPGTYHILLFADKANQILESDEGNNIVSKTFQVIVPVPKVDLAWKKTNFLPTSMMFGEPFNADIEFVNQGSAAAGNFDIAFYLSTDAQLDLNSDLKLSGYTVFGLPQVPFGLGTTSFRLISIPTTVAPGDYKLLVVLDDNAQVAEIDEANNLLVSDMQVLLNGRPDLVLIDLNYLPARANAESNFSYGMNFKNIGNAAVRPSFSFRLYLSTDQRVSIDDAVISDVNLDAILPVPVHFGFTRTGINATIPATTGTGSYFLIAVLDAADSVPELSESNNVLIRQLQVQGTQGVDLELTMALSNPNPANYSHFTVTLHLANRGINSATSIKVTFAKPFGAVYSGSREYSSSQGTFSPYGSQEWNVGTVEPGEVATLSINYFRLSPNTITCFAQVSAQFERDNDSTPGNGACCTPREDDEFAVVLGGLPVAPRSTPASQELPIRSIQLLSLFPNPVIDELSLNFSTQLGHMEYRIVNAQGHTMLADLWRGTPGLNTLRLDVRGLPEGMYTLQFLTTGRPEPLRFVKMDW
jgi:hypothetical protein